MSDKKHIDRLFQEGFKHFEATPSDAVWENIEAKLNEKNKKRRVIPIWWRYAGVAALLLLLLTVGGIYLNNADEDSNNQVVDTENKASEELNTDNNNSFNKQDKTNIVVSSDDANNSNKASDNPSDNVVNKLNSPKETSIVETSASKNQNESKTNFISSDKINIKKKSNTLSNQAVANIGSKVKKNAQQLLENQVIVANTSEEKNTIVNPENGTPIVNKEKAKNLIDNASKDNKAVAISNDKKIEDINENKEENKRTIEDALENAKDVIEDENSKLNNRWSVAPNAAPVYFNTLGEGSSIDPQFNSNSKSGEVNMSYGIAASYAVNKKLSIRSGINRVNLGYNTNDVLVFQSAGLSASSSALQNVKSSTSNADRVSALSSESLTTTSSESFAPSNGSINQALGYIEIPLEIQYMLSDKKLGVNLIGGFSSFFLNNNEIFSEEDNGTRTFLGEASNINNISYSANFGFGLNYKITKSFDLSLEPIFKYQFNTFNNTSGNFSPFFIGVYTGFAIKF